ncbi:MAG: D-aminoacyl-tRNA deacylase [Nitriliruptoraceae bacterium]
MRALVQRVHEAWVTSAERRGDPAEETGRIGPGIVVLVGVTHEDDVAAAVRLAERVHDLRIFADDDGAMNLSCADVGGEVLVVSQFTLYADTRKGRRPSYLPAAGPEHAEPLVEAFVARLEERGATLATGRFRTHMDVGLVNDGPVTILLEI